ncbi:MAG: class I SAM-dependent methyltransferase [Gammaproteobacteria bacterium]|nr:class I SAM-dependent methyltransferase [Gammaproteobacteria bacterium]
MCATLDYYEQYAARFAADTLDVDMSALHDRFLAELLLAQILDAGCGSGRDSRAFLQRGHVVHAIDASPAMARIASANIGQEVEVLRIEELEASPRYDGIWACASLLHLPEQAIPSALQRLWAALRPGGVLYLSFKHGEGEHQEAGRQFTDATETRLRTWSVELEVHPCTPAPLYWTTHVLIDRRPVVRRSAREPGA